MLMHCGCKYAAVPLDSEWTRWVGRNYKDIADGAVEVWSCMDCDAHRVTVMRNGSREDITKGGPELARFHDKSIIPDGALVAWDCEAISNGQ